MDLECADGLWDWTQQGTASPIWSQTEVHPVFVKTNVKYDQDNPAVDNNIGKDGMSAWVLGYVNGQIKYQGPWYSEGTKHSYSPLNYGTDKIFSNKQEFWYSLQVAGDRWDVWNVGYNEVFSPYSSPSTNDWANQNSGLFIYYSSYSGSGPAGVANIKIYKAGVGEPISLDSALHLTPPSRPMGLYVLPCDSLPETNGYLRVKIRWNHNQEPDMKRINGSDTIKRYIVYRSISANMSQTPPDALAYSENVYQFLDTIDILTGTLAEYTDTVNSVCTQPPVSSGEAWTPYPVRYRVQAVDKYQDKSVLSDFASTQGWNRTSISIGPTEEDGLFISENPEIPNEFALSQNYPNPFNPVTKIKYDIPIDGNVSIKIFDINGRLVMTAVNETKKAGRYEFEFSGVNLSSGIYYYRITSGNFSQVRKMILLK